MYCVGWTCLGPMYSPELTYCLRQNSLSLYIPYCLSPIDYSLDLLTPGASEGTYRERYIYIYNMLGICVVFRGFVQSVWALYSLLGLC